MHKTIFFIGSIMDSSQESLIVLKELAQRHAFDCVIATIPDKRDPATGFESICEHVAGELAQLETQGDVFIITYSSGAEVLFNLKIPPAVKAAELWSPSFFYQQRVAATLEADPQNDDLLVLPNTERISRRLAHDLDHLDTAKSRENLTIPYRVFLDSEADPGIAWQNATQTTYHHSYTKEQLTERFAAALEWFQQFKNEPE